MATSIRGILRGSRNAVIEDGQILKRSFTVSYLIDSDDGNDDEGDVYATTGLPVLGDAWVGQNGSTNPGCFVVRVRISEHDLTKKLWIVEVDYNSQLPDGGAGSAQLGDPPSWDPEIEWTAEKLPEIAISDNAGNPLLNPLNELYEVEIWRPLPVLRYSRWQAAFSAAVQTTYMGSINSDTFLGFPPTTAKMDEISAEARFLQGAQFWWVTYIVIFNPTQFGWMTRIPRTGTEFIDAFGDRVSAMGARGTPRINLTKTGSENLNAPQFDSAYVEPFRAFTPLIVGP